MGFVKYLIENLFSYLFKIIFNLISNLFKIIFYPISLLKKLLNIILKTIKIKKGKRSATDFISDFLFDFLFESFIRIVGLWILGLIPGLILVGLLNLRLFDSSLFFMPIPFIVGLLIIVTIKLLNKLFKNIGNKIEELVNKC